MRRERERERKYGRKEKIIISERFDIMPAASQWPAAVISGLREDDFFKDFQIYDPNNFCKDSCDPDFINFDHLCRGESVGPNCCAKRNPDTKGKPTTKSCWRFSFRWHQDECEKTNGFMIQLMALLNDFHDDVEVEDVDWELGAGQMIETDMANRANLKVFRVKQAFDVWSLGFGGRGNGISITYAVPVETWRPQDATIISDVVKHWYDSGRSDMSLEVITLLGGRAD